MVYEEGRRRKKYDDYSASQVGKPMSIVSTRINDDVFY